MKVHIIGLPGSGKTTLSEWIGRNFAVPVVDLDWVVYERLTLVENEPSEIECRMAEIAKSEAWTTEGAYHKDWLKPLLDVADVIMWLDFSLLVCTIRMLRRHAIAELRHNNQHPGWWRLARFISYTLAHRLAPTS